MEVYKMYNIMKNLINNKFYTNKDEAISKLSVFSAYKILDDEQYSELMDLTTEKYTEVIA